MSPSPSINGLANFVAALATQGVETPPWVPWQGRLIARRTRWPEGILEQIDLQYRSTDNRFETIARAGRTSTVPFFCASIESVQSAFYTNGFGISVAREYADDETLRTLLARWEQPRTGIRLQEGRLLLETWLGELRKHAQLLFTERDRLAHIISTL